MAQPSSRIPLPAAGDIVAGKYRITRPIGKGGMGLVFEAVDARGGAVALKILRPEVLIKPDSIARFEREARAAGALRGSNFVRVYDFGATSHGLPFMAMELLTGRDLLSELELRGRLPPIEAVGLIRQACEAMSEAHGAGIVHRDLKPSNIFITTLGERRVVKILDFGISKIFSEADAKLTATASSLGTPLYMSPEQIRSSNRVDARTDVWALGVILYEAIAGVPPFTGSGPMIAALIVTDRHPSLGARVAELPPGVEAIIDTALAKVPDQRFANAGTLGAALHSLGLPDDDGRVAVAVDREATGARRARYGEDDTLLSDPGGSSGASAAFVPPAPLSAPPPPRSVPQMTPTPSYSSPPMSMSRERPRSNVMLLAAVIALIAALIFAAAVAALIFFFRHLPAR